MENFKKCANLEIEQGINPLLETDLCLVKSHEDFLK
jgi:hypothetical protein